MPKFQETLHRHAPAPYHLRIHLVQRLPKVVLSESPSRTGSACVPFRSFRTQILTISSVVAAAPAIGAILYWAHTF